MQANPNQALKSKVKFWFVFFLASFVATMVAVVCASSVSAPDSVWTALTSVVISVAAVLLLVSVLMLNLRLFRYIHCDATARGMNATAWSLFMFTLWLISAPLVLMWFALRNKEYTTRLDARAM